MKNENIASRNVSALVILMMLSSTILAGFYQTGQDLWISFLVAFILFLPVALLYCKISTMFPQKGLYEIIIEVYGKWVGKVFLILIVWYALHLSALITRQYIDYAITTGLKNTPVIILTIALLAVAYYLANSGVEILGRWGVIICFIVLTSLCLTVIFSFNVFNYENLFPIYNHTNKQILNDSLLAYTTSFGETFLLLTIFSELKKKQSPYKAYLSGIIIGGITLLVVFSRNILILGAHLMQISVFPSFVSFRVIRINDFFDSFEVIISICLVLIGITKIAICLLAANRGISKVIEVKKEKSILLPTTLISLAVASILFSSVMESFDFLYIYRYYALIFQLVIPSFIFGGCIFKKLLIKKAKAVSPN